MRLYPFQKIGINIMTSFLKNGEANSCFNADEMGLGKTVQSIKVIEKLDCKHVLVVCPAIAKYVWKNEIEKWSKNNLIELWISSLNYDDFFTGDNKDKRITWEICNYDLTHRKSVLNQLEKNFYDCIIFDEAHYLKNKKAKRTRACLANLFPRSTYRIFLSGTPFTTSIVDGFNAFNKCAPTDFPTFTYFADTFAYSRITPWGIKYFGVKNPADLSRIIKSKFYLRRRKSDVLTELPPKQFQCVPLPIKYAVVPKTKDEAKLLEVELLRIKAAIEHGQTFKIPKTMAEHRRLQGEAKVPPICEFVEELLEQNIPVVLFAWHKNVIAAYAEYFKKYRPAVITGATSVTDRNDAVDHFQLGATNLFIGNILAGGVGITLSRSSTCVLAELDWSPANVSQAIDRLHRISQKSSVIVYYFVVDSSIDVTLTNVVLDRARIFKSVLEGEPT